MSKAKKTDWITSSILFVLFALLFLYLGKDAKSPLIYPDEAGYLGWARILAGKTGDGLHYYPGYSLLLAPFFLFSDDITVVYPMIIKLNAALGALIPVLLYRLSTAWCKQDAVLGRAGISAVAALYPAVTSYVRLAWCETLLTVLLLAMALCIFSLQNNRKQVLSWLLLLVFGVWAFLTHPRGLMFCFGAAVAVIVLLRDQKRVLLTGGIIGVMLIGVGAFLLLSNPANIGSAHVTEQLSRILTPSGMYAFLTTMLSHFCYLLWSTYGLAAAAIYYGILGLKKETENKSLWVFVLASFLFTWCLSAFYMSHHERPDHILYGRYLDVTVPLMLLAAFSCMSKKRVALPIWLICIAAVIVTGALYAQEASNLDAWIIHSTGMFYYRLILRYFRFWWAAALFALLAVLVWLAEKRRLGIALVFVLFLVQAIYMKQTYFQPEAEYKAHSLQIIRQLPQNAEVYIADSDVDYTWEYYNYSIYRPDVTFSNEDEGQAYVLSRQLRQGETLLAAEVQRPVYLYTREQAERVDYPGELTELDAVYHWKETEEGLEVTVQNQGSPWLCFDAVKDLRFAVRLSVRQFDGEKQMISDTRYDFTDNLYRNDSQTFFIQPSEDCVFIELQPMTEFTAWFSERGDAPLLLHRQAGIFVEDEGLTLPSDHSFCRIEFAHLKTANVVEHTSYAGNLNGFYANDTGAEATIENIKMPGGTGVLLLETEDRRDNVSAVINEEITVSAEKYQEGAYHFPFAGIPEITSVTIRTDTVNPFEESGLPDWMSFLSLDSNLKPVQFAVHRMTDLLGKDVNNHDFGLKIKALEVRLEGAE